jgi:hypothetical protein
MRTVILDLLAAAMLDAAIVDPKLDRVRDAWQGLEWRLCRRPADGVPRKFGYYLYKQLGILELRIPTIIALYTFDDDTVTVSALAFYAA